MKAEELRAKTVDELNKIILDLRKSQMSMRFKKANAQMEDSSEMRKVRRTIARVKTILTQKEQADKKSA